MLVGLCGVRCLYVGTLFRYTKWLGVAGIAFRHTKNDHRRNSVPAYNNTAMIKYIALTLPFIWAILACQTGTTPAVPKISEEIPASNAAADTVAPVQTEIDETESKAQSAAPPPPSSTPISSSAARSQGDGGSRSAILQNGFADMAALDPTIRLDIRYATANNFTKSKIYDCPRCLLRPEAAEAIVTANKSLKKRSLTLIMFDCYRPKPYQQRLWDKVPNPDYVTPPAKGSMHSRGAAVDLSIVDAQGKELDMGTPYDFFGEAAHTDYKRLSAQVLENRALLRNTLEAVGFKGIRTEWWHFSYQKRTYPLSDYLWPCPGDKD